MEGLELVKLLEKWDNIGAIRTHGLLAEKELTNVISQLKTEFNNVGLADVSGCSEQWHVLSANMGDGKCSKCGKALTDFNYR